MAEQPVSDPIAQRVADAVRRALSLVGPPEHSVERLAEERPEDEPVA